MATKKGLLISGKVGPHIYKIVKGEQIITSRMAPGTMKRTEEMINNNNTFGMATSLASQVRKSLVIPLNGFQDNEMINRLNSKMVKILGQYRDAVSREYRFEGNSFERLEGFEFNVNSNVRDLFKAMPVTTLEDGMLSIKFKSFGIPGMLKFPFKSYHCKLSVCLSLFRLQDGTRIATAESQMIEITKDKTTVGPFKFTFTVPPGCFYVVSLFLEYAIASKIGWKSIHSKNFNPGVICAAQISEGVEEGDSLRSWIKMMKYK